MPAYNSKPFLRRPLTAEEILALIPEPPPPEPVKIYEVMYIAGDVVLSKNLDTMMAYGGNDVP